MKNQFNLIVAGCGTGKTYWVLNNLLEHFTDIKPYEILFVTSRSITKQQQSQNLGTTLYNYKDKSILQYWNGLEDDTDLLSKYGIMVMTYNQLISDIKSSGNENAEVLANAKIIVLDECHTMFCDTFISGLSELKLWIRERVYRNCIYLIGLTATPGIVDYYADDWSTPINRINKECITRYRAKQMICTDFKTVPYLFASNRLLGKTIMMCSTVNDCYMLAEKIPNAAIIISKNAQRKILESATSANREAIVEADRQMTIIRDYIAKYESLPDTFVRDGETRDLDVLLCTSTLREGVNLREKSNVRNVVCCLTDELHVTQFVGRCRYNIDNLVIVDTYVRKDNAHLEPYVQTSRNLFKQYMQNKECIRWFYSVQHLVEHDAYGMKKFVLGPDDAAFADYINSKWLVPHGVDYSAQEKYRIWRESDRDEIVNKSKQYDMFPLTHESRITFTGVMRLLTRTFGYDVEDGRAVMEGERKRYKLIVNFDEAKFNAAKEKRKSYID